MQPRITVDTREFRETLHRYMLHTKRDLATVLNGWSYDVAREAIKATKKTTTGKVGSSLRKRARVGRKGQKKRGPVGAILVNWKRGKRGQPGLYGAEMSKAVDKLTAARKRAIGSLKVSWFPALAVFAAKISKGHLKVGYGAKEYQNRMRKRGGGTAAKPGWRPFAILWSEPAAVETSNQGLAEKLVEAGLQKAVSKVVIAKNRRLERKLQQTANRYRGRR